MVTKTVISVTQSEAAALAATESWSSVEAKSIIKNNAPTKEVNTQEVLAPLCNRPSWTARSRAQHPAVTISGGKKRAHPSAQNTNASTSYYYNNSNNLTPFLNQWPSQNYQQYSLPYFPPLSYSQLFQPSLYPHQLLSQQNSAEDLISNNNLAHNKRQKVEEADTFILDLSNVPPQPTIPKSKGRIKDGSSKYTGVYFDKGMNKWQARIMIDGKERRIGHYEDEEEAAVDYAKAVFKYKGPEALDKARGVEKPQVQEAPLKIVRAPLNSFVSYCLSDVPTQPPILRNKGKMKEGISKYAGIYFNKANKKWMAKIEMYGKSRFIGCYEDEEKAAIDYARAVFKFKDPGDSKKQKSNVIDLSDVPPQPPIPKSKGKMKEGSSKYTGVSFHRNMWRARIKLDGKFLIIGNYEDEEEAAIDYARAVFKYKRQGQGDAKKQKSNVIDLSDVPPQPPIPKTKGRMKEGSSKYTGIYFLKSTNKWEARIVLDGKYRCIGHYEDEEEAAVDYARAVFKYKDQVASKSIDLSDVPPQPPIPKSKGRMKEGSSKYTGVSFHRNMWQARIALDGKFLIIGSYEDEEEAAIDYARAVFKYKRQGQADSKKQKSNGIDLSDVPPQPPIPKSKGRMKEGSSKYTGVSFHRNMWQARIALDGKFLIIGSYEDEEEAAIDYARAVFKYKRQGQVASKKQKSNGIDLSDVPPQPPIPKSKGRMKEGSSKYTGIYFLKSTNKWEARIVLDGKYRCIGHYDDEEEAAADYARAVFKYKDQVASKSIDLSDVPPQPPIPKSKGRMKEGSSKYTGVSFHRNMWQARIALDGKFLIIGSYEDEEEAAIDYARAVFKYKRQGQVASKKQKSNGIDLSDVPPQPPIPKSKGRMKEGSSKYTGIYFLKSTNKWEARIVLDGKYRCIGHYDDEEEAAADYARAVFKYKDQVASKSIDLSDVPPQPPIPKSKGRMKEGSSKYTGVSFHRNMWQARIALDGKFLIIGSYEDEEEAAIDYARAVFKYKRQGQVASKKQKSNGIDLSDVPPQPPILKSKGWMKEGSSKYTGVSFDRNKWLARIDMDGKFRVIGSYENEEEAAVDYARAVFKYKKQKQK